MTVGGAGGNVKKKQKRTSESSEELGASPNPGLASWAWINAAAAASSVDNEEERDAFHENNSADDGDDVEGRRTLRGSGGHPLNVRPWGTLLFATTSTSQSSEYAQAVRNRKQGLGYFSHLEDHLLLQVLGSLDAKLLSKLACTSKIFYSYASHDELWRSLAFDAFNTETKFYDSWKETYWRNVRGMSLGGNSRRLCSAVYSDLLYQPWYCSNLEIPKEWVEVENIPRCSNLSRQEFQDRFEKRNLPVIVTDVVTRWPAFEKWKDRQYIVDAFENNLVHVGGYEFTMKQYYEYADETNDEMPLYLFDKHFASKSSKLQADYSVPEYFDEDLFQVLGSERPDYRWLIIGPAKSGSSFHKDPNCTSAWNALITGKKKWIMFPPHITPPGVHASENGLHVATSVSIIEWFLNFYEASKELEYQPRECVVQAGEVIFVPRGWWHLVINLEESVALTQNYVSSANLKHVLKYIKNPELVSGCPLEERQTLHSRFHQALMEKRAEVLEVLEGKQSDCPKDNNIANLFERGGGEKKEESGFKFNFF